MQIIPVIDLLGGQVVRGVAGRRAEYRPIVSQLAAGSDPVDMAAAFCRLGLPVVYLADLDAISGGQPSFSVYRQLLAAGTRLIVDAGIACVAAAQRLATCRHAGQPLAGVVAGLETLPNPEILRDMVRTIGSDRLVFSLDLRAGRLMSAAPAWQPFTPLQCALAALEAGVRRLIVLDVAAVGVAGGVTTLELCRQLRQRDANFELISGGGVRGAGDLDALREAGCSAALVASALHDGALFTSERY